MTPVPEEHGLPTAALLALIDDLDGQDPHALVVARHGTVLARAAWAPYRTDRATLVYSVSKSVTALAVLLLAEEGRLGLDDPVDRHLDLPNPHRLTLRRLLTMTTGHSRDQTLAMPVDPRVLLATPPAYPVGSRFAYSSPATATLARVVAAVSGQQPGEYLRPRLFDPLGIGPRWWRQQNGVDQGFSGLHLTVEDQARIGTALLPEYPPRVHECSSPGPGDVHSCTLDGAPGVIPVGVRAVIGGEFVPSAAAGSDAHSGGEPDPAIPDWSRGYGYGVWAGRHGFRMDGAFGQFTLVLPDTGLVVAYQGATTDTQRTLDVLWRLVESVSTDRPLAADPAVTARWRERVAGLDSWTARDRLTPADGPGPDLTGWTLTDTTDGGRLLATPGGALLLYPDRWSTGILTLPGEPGVLPVAARAERLPDGTVRAHLALTSSPHRVLLTRTAAGSLDARWHTAPLWHPELRTLLVPPQVADLAAP